MKIAFIFPFVAVLAGCAKPADVASKNISEAADNFELSRRITFYNGITGTALLVIEGLCSLGSGRETKSLTVTCKTGPSDYKKHFLGLSDNVTYVAEQVDGVKASPYHYRVTFNPAAIIPNITGVN
jgi:hypothetical protein